MPGEKLLLRGEEAGSEGGRCPGALTRAGHWEDTPEGGGPSGGDTINKRHTENAAPSGFHSQDDGFTPGTVLRVGCGDHGPLSSILKQTSIAYFCITTIWMFLSVHAISVLTQSLTGSTFRNLSAAVHKITVHLITGHFTRAQVRY